MRYFVIGDYIFICYLSALTNSWRMTIGLFGGLPLAASDILVGAAPVDTSGRVVVPW